MTKLSNSSIRNHSNLTAAQLAAACGHGECARYLEAAATLQESEAKGIYGQISPQPTQSLKPAFHDVTTREPRSTMQCINGHQNFPHPVTNCFLNGSSDCYQDCAMDESDSQGPIGAGGDFSSPHLANGHTGGDVTTHMGICTNVVPVAGRKRTREDGEEIQFKRMKKCEPMLCERLAAPTQNGVHSSTLNGVHRSPKILNQLSGMNGLNRRGWPPDPTPSPTFANLSNSAVEHDQSILLEQGYDSMMCDAMLPSCLG